MKRIIGWREWIGLPDLGIPKIKVKVDTGARSSALHAQDIERFRKNQKDWIRFVIYPFQDEKNKVVQARAPVLDLRKVKSSSGHVNERYTIETKAQLMGFQWLIELTLTNRDMMGYRMLLGRQALKRNFIIDPNRSFLGKNIL